MILSTTHCFSKPNYTYIIHTLCAICKIFYQFIYKFDRVTFFWKGYIYTVLCIVLYKMKTHSVCLHLHHHHRNNLYYYYNYSYNKMYTHTNILFLCMHHTIILMILSIENRRRKIAFLLLGLLYKIQCCKERNII